MAWAVLTAPGVSPEWCLSRAAVVGTGARLALGCGEAVHVFKHGAVAQSRSRCSSRVQTLFETWPCHRRSSVWPRVSRSAATV